MKNMKKEVNKRKMTGERFKVINISTNGMKTLFKLDNDNLSVYDVARLVNELLKENEQLKNEINMLKITIGRNEGYIYRLTHTEEWR